MTVDADGLLCITNTQAFLSNVLRFYTKAIDHKARALLTLETDAGVPAAPLSSEPVESSASHGLQGCGKGFLEFLFPSLTAHPALHGRLASLTEHMVRAADDAAMLRELRLHASRGGYDNDNRSLPDDPNAIASKGIEQFVASLRHPRHGGTDPSTGGAGHMMGLSDVSEEARLIGLLSAELRTHQELTATLLGCLVQSDRQVALTLKQSEKRRAQVAELQKELLGLRNELEDIQNKAKQSYDSLQKKFDEKELRWRHTVQHLRAQLDGRAAGL